jgi:hypothetical protein
LLTALTARNTLSTMKKVLTIIIILEPIHEVCRSARAVEGPLSTILTHTVHGVTGRRRRAEGVGGGQAHALVSCEAGWARFAVDFPLVPSPVNPLLTQSTAEHISPALEL